MEKFKNKALAKLISSMAKMDQLERNRVRQKQKLYSGLAKSDMVSLVQSIIGLSQPPSPTETAD